MATQAEVEELLNGPALAPPKGVIPNFENPSNLNTLSYALISIFIIAPTFVLYIRLYTKAHIIKKVTLDDYVVFVAWLFFAGFSVPSLMIVKNGAGVHQWNVRLKNLGYFELLILIGSTLNGFAIFFTKLAILLQYLRIFVPQKKTDFMYWASHGLIWINLVFYLISTFLELFPCTPISKAWDPLMTNGHCLNRYTINIIATAINLSTDILCLILPQRAIWKLQMSTRRKLAISAVFLVGVLSCASSTARLYYSVKLSQDSDYTYYVLLFGYFAFAEMSFGLIACCLPTAPKFFQTLKHANLFTGVSSYMRTFIHKSRSGSYWHSSNYTTERASTGTYTGREAKARTRAYTPLGENHEMLSTSRTDRSDYATDKRALTGQNPDSHIKRTVHIEAVREPTGESSLDIENGRVGPWNGQTKHHFQPTEIYS